MTMNKSLHATTSITLLLIMLGLVYLVIIYPALQERNENKQRLDNLSHQVQEFTRANASIDSLKQQIRQLETMDIDAGGFLQASSNTLAAAEMQNLLKVILEQNNANLVSAQVMNENKEELYPRITVRAFVKTDIEGLRSMLYALSTNSPLLIIDNINIQKRQGSQTDDLLDIRFEISGYIKNLEAA